MDEQPHDTDLVAFQVRSGGADRERVVSLFEAEILATRLTAIRRVLVAILAAAGLGVPVAIFTNRWPDSSLLREAAGIWVLFAASTVVIWIAERVWYRRRDEIAEELSEPRT